MVECLVVLRRKGNSVVLVDAANECLNELGDTGCVVHGAADGRDRRIISVS